MSNLDNERDERDEDSHEDRGISECTVVRRPLIAVIFGGGEGFDARNAVAAFLTHRRPSLRFQSATLASSPPCWSATPTPQNAGGGTGAGPGRRAITVGRVTLIHRKVVPPPRHPLKKKGKVLKLRWICRKTKLTRPHGTDGRQKVTRLYWNSYSKMFQSGI